jgi:hypothetical protein
MLEETGLPYEVVPVDTSKGEQPVFAAGGRFVRFDCRHDCFLETAAAASVSPGCD